MRFLGKAQIEALKQGASTTKSDVVTDEPAKTDAPAKADEPAKTDAPATAEKPKKKKWVIPVIIGGGVLVVGILTYVLLKKKK